MSTYRQTTDPVVKCRYCDTCRKPIVGITERGLDYWLDVTPLTRELEAVYHAAGRPTFHVQPRANRTAWLDWRNPVTSTESPLRGIVLVQHVHAKPGPKADPPPWLITDYRVTNAPTSQEAMF